MQVFYLLHSTCTNFTLDCFFLPCSRKSRKKKRKRLSSTQSESNSSGLEVELPNEFLEFMKQSAQHRMERGGSDNILYSVVAYMIFVLRAVGW